MRKIIPANNTGKSVKMKSRTTATVMCFSDYLAASASILVHVSVGLCPCVQTTNFA